MVVWGARPEPVDTMPAQDRPVRLPEQNCEDNPMRISVAADALHISEKQSPPQANQGNSRSLRCLRQAAKKPALGFESPLRNRLSMVC
jgi:hypothetical protein